MSDQAVNQNPSSTPQQTQQQAIAQPQPINQPVPQQAVQQTSEQTIKTAGKPVVLLIEDDLLLVKMYKTKFLNEGFQILTAGDGEIGLKLALEQKVDFIILDVMMPKMSGLDFLSQLRQKPKGQNIPVIVLSNLAQQEKAKKALKLGAKEFLIKASLTPGQVVAKVRQYLGK